jgi:UDP-glucose 4-epimerase
VREVIQAVGERLGVEPRIDILARRPGDPASLVADPSALRDAQRWSPRYPSVQAIVDSAVEWELWRRAR